MTQSKEDARKEGIVVPETIDEYCIKERPKEEDNLDCLDFGTFSVFAFERGVSKHFLV